MIRSLRAAVTPLRSPLPLPPRLPSASSCRVPLINNLRSVGFGGPPSVRLGPNRCDAKGW
jgi:hypothetical protein